MYPSVLFERGLEGLGVAFEALPEDFFAAFRSLVPDGRGGEDESGVADGIPVVFRSIEPGLFLVFRGVEGLFFQGLDDLFAFFRGQDSVEPVIADRDGHGHLPDVQEMARVPVGEGADGEHLVDRPAGVGVSAMDPVGIGEIENPFQGLPGYAEKAFPGLDPLDGRQGEDLVAECRDDTVGLPDPYRGAGRFRGGEGMVSGAGQQPGMGTEFPAGRGNGEKAQEKEGKKAFCHIAKIRKSFLNREKRRG